MQHTTLHHDRAGYGGHITVPVASIFREPACSYMSSQSYTEHPIQDTNLHHRLINYRSRVTAPADLLNQSHPTQDAIMHHGSVNYRGRITAPADSLNHDTNLHRGSVNHTNDVPAVTDIANNFGGFASLYSSTQYTGHHMQHTTPCHDWAGYGDYVTGNFDESANSYVSNQLHTEHLTNPPHELTNHYDGDQVTSQISDALLHQTETLIPNALLVQVHLPCASNLHSIPLSSDELQGLSTNPIFAIEPQAFAQEIAPSLTLNVIWKDKSLRSLFDQCIALGYCVMVQYVFLTQDVIDQVIDSCVDQYRSGKLDETMAALGDNKSFLFTCPCSLKYLFPPDYTILHQRGAFRYQLCNKLLKIRNQEGRYFVNNFQVSGAKTCEEVDAPFVMHKLEVGVFFVSFYCTYHRIPGWHHVEVQIQVVRDGFQIRCIPGPAKEESHNQHFIRHCHYIPYP